MKSENIYDALTDISDELIMEAQEHKLGKSRKTIIQWCAIAASLMLVIGIGSYILTNRGSFPVPGGSTGGGGRIDDSTTFMSYAGPVFPLSVLSDAKGISASRNILFDFSGYGENRSKENNLLLNRSDVLITDSYTLNNNTNYNETVQILYPFASDFSDLNRLLPLISSGGKILEAELTAGSYSGGFTDIEGLEGDRVNLVSINSWEDYISLLADGSYLRNALGDWVMFDQTVTVYEFINVQGNHEKSDAPTLAAEFNLDYERTKVLTFNFNGAEYDYENGYMRRSFFVPNEDSPAYNRSYYMIVVGDDITNLTIQGYENGGCHDGEEVEHTFADVTRYEAVFGDILALMLDNFMEQYNRGRAGEPDYSDNFLSNALLYRASTELLRTHGVMSDNAAWRYHTGELADIFSETIVIDRVFYLTAEIDIPAGESIVINIAMIKPGSFDFYGSGSENTGIYGYGMLTKLSSNLLFHSMTAEIMGTERISIVKQNFGFDIDNEILKVALDNEEPHYYLEVRGAGFDE